MRAQKLLEQHGIRSYVKRVSKNLQISGCGYGLELNGADIPAAQSIIVNAGIRIVEVASAV